MTNEIYMNINDIVNQHSNMIRSILIKSTGAIGEIIVAQKLSEFGYEVNLLNNNSKERDLHVRAPNGKEFYVEVKCGRQVKPTWWVGRRPQVEHGSEIWCLVAAPRQPDSLPNPADIKICVLTAKEAANCSDASPYIDKHTKGGDIRWKHAVEHLDAWHKLPGRAASDLED